MPASRHTAFILIPLALALSLMSCTDSIWWILSEQYKLLTTLQYSLFAVNFVTLLTQGGNMNKLSNRADAALDYLLCLIIGCGLAAALISWWSA